MKKLIAILLLGSMTCLTIGCGVKGALYFPQNETQQQK